MRKLQNFLLHFKHFDQFIHRHNRFTLPFCLYSPSFCYQFIIDKTARQASRPGAWLIIHPVIIDCFHLPATE